LKIFFEKLGLSDYLGDDVRKMGPLKLAFIGDAVYELHVRFLSLKLESNRPHDLNSHSVVFSKAKSQSFAINSIWDELTQKEQEIVKWGRNQKTSSSPKNTSIQQYRLATGLETLIGFLYMNEEKDRLEELMALIVTSIRSFYETDKE
jgi:ribonuclease-3 family protein